MRPLAFPGTNVKVYGEIETEFTKYSCRLLDGVGEALVVYGYGNCIMAACADVGYSGGGGGDSSSSSDAMKKKIAQHTGGEPQRQRYAVSDLPTAHKRVVVYTDRVIRVYHSVLHCLIQNGGKARERNKIRTAAARVVATTTTDYGREWSRLQTEFMLRNNNYYYCK